MMSLRSIINIEKTVLSLNLPTTDDLSGICYASLLLPYLLIAIIEYHSFYIVINIYHESFNT